MANKYSVKVDADISSYNEQMDSAADSTKKFQDAAEDANKSVKDLGKKGSKSVKDLLSEMKDIEKGGRSVSNYRKKLGGLTRDIQDLTINYRNLSKEMQNSSVGQEALLKINELQKEAAMYKDAIGDAQQAIRQLSSDTFAFDAAKQGIDLMSSALQSYISLGFSSADTTEKLSQVLGKLKMAEQGAATAIKALNMLNKDTGVIMQAIGAIQSAAAVKAAKLAQATGKATLAQKAFNLVAKANPYVLLASAIVAVGAAVAGWMAVSKRNNSVQTKALDIQKQYNKALKDASDSAGSMIGTFKFLEGSYKSLKTEAEKQVWIKEHKKDFEKLGLSIEDVNSADDTFIKNADKVIEAMKLRAEAAALMSLYEEEYAKAYKESLKLQDKQAKKGGGMTGPRAWKKAGLKEGEDYFNTPIVMQSSAGAQVMNNWQLTESGRKKMEQYGKEAGNAYLEGVEASLNPLISEVESKTKRAIQLESELLAYQKKDDSSTSSDKKTKSIQEQTKAYTSQLDALKKQKTELENGMHYIDEGTEAWKNQLSAINEVNKKIEELENNEKAFIASLNRKPIELLPIVNVDDIVLPKTIDGPEIKLKVKNPEDELNSLLESANKAAEKVNERFRLGLIDRDVAESMIKNINDTLKARGIRASVSLDLDENSLSDFAQRISSSISSIDTISDISEGVVGSINNIYESISNLNSKLEESKNGWESFFALFSTGITIMDSISRVLETVAAVSELVNGVKSTSIATTKADTAATLENAEAHLTAAGAKGAEAAAGAGQSVSGIPIVGPALAVAAIAAVIAAILSAISKAQKFAGGGIVGGNSFSGDKILAGLNSREMVLNQKQQANLFKLLNEGRIRNDSFNTGNVTFKIHGSDLVGTLNNYSNKRSKI